MWIQRMPTPQRNCASMMANTKPREAIVEVWGTGCRVGIRFSAGAQRRDKGVRTWIQRMPTPQKNCALMMAKTKPRLMTNAAGPRRARSSDTGIKPMPPKIHKNAVYATCGARASITCGTTVTERRNPAGKWRRRSRLHADCRVATDHWEQHSDPGVSGLRSAIQLQAPVNARAQAQQS